MRPGEILSRTIESSPNRSVVVISCVFHVDGFVDIYYVKYETDGQNMAAKYDQLSSHHSMYHMGLVGQPYDNPVELLREELRAVMKHNAGWAQRIPHDYVPFVWIHGTGGNCSLRDPRNGEEILRVKLPNGSVQSTILGGLTGESYPFICLLLEVMRRCGMVPDDLVGEIPEVTEEVINDYLEAERVMQGLHKLGGR